MQLCHTHRQLLSRCSLRWYSVGTSSDTTAASDVQVPPRLKRPVASTFGGINIRTSRLHVFPILLVFIPINPHIILKKMSWCLRNHVSLVTKRKNPVRVFHERFSPAHSQAENIFMLALSNGSNDQSSDARRMSQTERKKGMGRGGASSTSSWGDGLVSFSFSSRLHQRQAKSTLRGSNTEPYPEEFEAPSRKQKFYQAQHPQKHGHRRGQKQQEHDDASPTHRRGQTETRKSTTAAAVQRGNRTSAPSTDDKNNKLQASSMTRPSSSPTFNPDPKSTTAATTATAATTTKADIASLPPPTQQPTTTSSDRKARLATLSSTNLNSLFRTMTNTHAAGISLPTSTTASASASARARVRSVLERSAGDYSRFLPRDVGARKDASRLPTLRAARHALATRRDLSLEQRRVALHIIGGLVQPRREVRTS